MNMRNNKLLIDLLWYRLRILENTKTFYEQNPNLPPNVRRANVQLVQNDTAAFKKRLKKRIRFAEFNKELED